MEQKTVLPKSITPSKDQEKGVCGTGKHRVININPVLLTPISVSKIYPPTTASKASGTRSLDPAAALVSNDINSIGTLTHSFPVDSSMDMATQSVSDSELTDTTDIASISEISNVSYDTKRGNDLKTHQLSFQNFSDFSDENLMKSSQNQPRVFANARRERTIEISPSLLLPVTAMPSNNYTVSTNASPGITQLKQNFQGGPRTTISTSSSLSDLQGSRISVNEDIDGLSTFSEAQDSIRTSCTEGTPNDYEKIKDTLRLADADIAILVSSKQQLQLDLHKQAEQVKVLSHRLLESEAKYQDVMITVEDLRRTLEQKEKNFKSEMENMQGHLQHSTTEMELLRKSLDTAQAGEASHKIEIELLQHLSEEQQVKAQRIEKELNNASDKNRELERLLREATAKDEGIESFVRHLTEVKNDVSTRLQDKVMECEKLQIENKMLAAKIADVEHTNEHLMEKSSKHEKRFRETDAENIKLQSKLSVETREKIDLNSAVAKLRSDLGNVQSSFQKLKKQFLDKAMAVQSEATKRSELEDEVKSLHSQISKLTNVNAEMRLRDKNVQIEQLLTQSRTSSQERSKLEKSIKDLQEHIDSKEKSWVNAFEQEQALQQSLKEKDDVVLLKTQKIKELEIEIKNDQIEILQLKNSLEHQKKSVSMLETLVKEKEKNLAEAIQQEQALSVKISTLENEISGHIERNQEAELKHQNRVDELLQNSKLLTGEIDRLQQSLVMKQEEIKSVGHLKESDHKHEASNMEQLHLLSELQSARRELSHQIESLQQEKNGLESSLKIAENKINGLEQLLVQEKQFHADAVEKVSHSKNAMEDEYRDKIENLSEKLKQSEDVKRLVGNELKDAKELNQSLSQQRFVLESETEKLREEAVHNKQETEEGKSQVKRAKEELELVKNELSNVMMQLSDAVNGSDITNDKYVAEIAKLQNECGTLRSAVVRQQGYCVSLQKHYQEWAKEAEEKMRYEIHEARRKSEESQVKFAEMISQQNAERIEDGSGDKRLNDDSSSWQSNGAHAAEVTRSVTQTNEYDVVPNNDELQERYDNEISVLVKEKIHLLQENTQQAEMIAALEGRIGIESSNERTIFEDFASQTSFEHLPLLKYPKEETLLKDASTLTIDFQSVNHTNQDFEDERHAIEEMCVGFEKRIDIQRRENVKLQETIALLELNLSELKHSHSYMLEDSSTQTNHNDMPILLSGYDDNNTATLLEDGSTQTDHGDVTVMDMHLTEGLDALKEELSLSKLQVETLSANVEELNAKNLSLTSYINDLRKSSKSVTASQEGSAAVATSTISETNSNSEGRKSAVNGELLCNNDNDKSCSQCENCDAENRNLPNPSLPSPMAILQTMESKKLKAYKKTVTVLKKQLKDANKNIKNLQAEMKVLLEHRSLHTKNDGADKLSAEPERNFENELYDAKKRSALQLEDVKRKALAERKKLESKVGKMTERLSGLTEANKELRMSVECLQVKLTERTRQNDITTKERNRYQMRARRLQASLRSLAWINGNQDKSLFLSDDLLLDDSLPESIAAESSIEIPDMQSDTGSEIKSPGLVTSKNSLPASVVEIEASLKDLQSEIIALERQMQEHNSAVKKSKNQWTRLKKESQSHQPSGNDLQNINSNDVEIV